MELPELKTDLHRTLLGPLSFATELFGALLPGCVFTILICVKQHWITHILGYPSLGYKTKIALALLASYIAGKVVVSTIFLGHDFGALIVRRIKRKNRTPSENQPTNRLDALVGALSDSLLDAPDSFKAFLGGLAVGPSIGEKIEADAHYSAYNAGVLFHMSTGLVFISSAAIPGDGNLRLLEALVGTVLFAQGLNLWSKRGVVVAGFMGKIVNAYLAGLQPGQLSAGVKTIFEVIVRLYNLPVPPTAKPSPPDPQSRPSSDPSSSTQPAVAAPSDKSESSSDGGGSKS